MFDVNHRLDSSGWTVTLAGKMRATMSNIFDGFQTLKDLEDTQIENYITKAKNDETKKKIAEAERNRIAEEQYKTSGRKTADEIQGGKFR